MIRSLGTTGLAVIAWSTCSVGMTVINKAGVSRTDAPLALLTLQMIVTAAVCTVASGRQLLSQFGKGWHLWAIFTPVLFSATLGSCAAPRARPAPFALSPPLTHLT